jgi:hypothetical protein
MSAADLKHGTRFEFVLESSEQSARAIYRAFVRKPDAPEVAAIVEITQSAARIVSGAEALEPALQSQLVALAKTIGKRADDAPWPRRIQRWRQPGVR